MALKFWTADVSGLSRTQVKSKLWEELRLKADIGTKGITISEAALSSLHGNAEFSGQKLGGGRNRKLHTGKELPACIYLPYGLKVTFNWNEASPYVIDIAGGKQVLTYEGNTFGEIQYAKQPKYHERKSSDGVPLGLIGRGDFYDRIVGVTYSNECCYIDKDEDCLFCNINYNKDLYSEKFGPYWRTPKQVAETVQAAFEEGVADHVNITGGVIAERRELEYYMDTGEEIRKALKVDAFNGTAVATAPTDFGNIDKLKEAGFRTTAMNLELWDKDFYKAVCPGKANNSGGWENWINALEYAVKVFGWGRVRSNFVAGIEPMPKTLQGFEYLCGKGVVCSFNIWMPNVGSAFEGHRSPETEWYIDLGTKLAEFWGKNGFTFDKIHDATAGDHRLPSDIFRIENEVFDIYEAAGKAE
ncbi:radical SAM domain protein [Treponema primitia ZAS-2]|uniref:Radical SAM domain protein n=1 Tax=Treponema primitia (strain ATCC BAA-887 / DSM 12427 / ZAS-2) TaxID=545694 RepID=F5YK11_TREPZ|nr:radical SAM protein [Treponema primitia]AEF84622.1 radical SAM domain protein [Treponema primitia ZAS-2]